MISQIDGVIIHQIEYIVDERGGVEKLPDTSFLVEDVYVTYAHQGAIKAWHGYETKKVCYTLVSGKAKLVLWDGRVDSKTSGVIDEIFLSPEANFSVEIPPGVYAGYKGISKEDAVIVIRASEPYLQIYRLPFDGIDYDWALKHG